MASLALRSILRTSPWKLPPNYRYFPVRLAATHIAKMSNIATLDASVFNPIEVFMAYFQAVFPRTPSSRSGGDSVRGESSQKALL